MTRRKQPIQLIRGHATHRRTEGEYVGVLLESVTLDDWREVVNGAKALAKAGDAQSRAWLAQYLMGKPAGQAPTPLTVVVTQLNGSDPVVDRLAKPFIDREKYPILHTNDDREAEIRAILAAELAGKMERVEVGENAAAARVPNELPSAGDLQSAS
jgi:hypothetical protein